MSRDAGPRGQAFCVHPGKESHRKVFGEDVLTFALALRDKCVPVFDIASKPTVKTGVDAGRNPSLASLYRTLAEAGDLRRDTVGPLG
ncbi:hypothetical protein ACLQ2R_26795 [Streptosporangium sp. DT93]|uniref:hypothetical protein n=1 Tax=Streptosporangium sp. DT93 TaxID=3393428 RepID=UPI003CF7F3CF